MRNSLWSILVYDFICLSDFHYCIVHIILCIRCDSKVPRRFTGNVVLFLTVRCLLVAVFLQRNTTSNFCFCYNAHEKSKWHPENFCRSHKIDPEEALLQNVLFSSPRERKRKEEKECFRAQRRKRKPIIQKFNA